MCRGKIKPLMKDPLQQNPNEKSHTVQLWPEKTVKVDGPVCIGQCLTAASLATSDLNCSTDFTTTRRMSQEGGNTCAEITVLGLVDNESVKVGMLSGLSHVATFNVQEIGPLCLKGVRASKQTLVVSSKCLDQPDHLVHYGLLQGLGSGTMSISWLRFVFV